MREKNKRGLRAYGSVSSPKIFYNDQNSLFVRVAQLVRANVGRCGLNKRHIVLGSNLATNDILIYPVLVIADTISTLRFGSLWRVLRAWP